MSFSVLISDFANWKLSLLESTPCPRSDAKCQLCPSQTSLPSSFRIKPEKEVLCSRPLIAANRLLVFSFKRLAWHCCLVKATKCKRSFLLSPKGRSVGRTQALGRVHPLPSGFRTRNNGVPRAGPLPFHGEVWSFVN